MPYLVDTKGVYSPEVVKAMASAFDRVCRFLPKSVAGIDELRQQYALKIISLVDQGQQDSERLFELALYEVATANYLASTLPARRCMTA